MDNQPIMSASPSPFSSPSRGQGGGSLLIILVVILGLGAIVFAVLTLIFFNQASVATKTLESQKAAAVAKAKAEQQKADEIAATVAGQSPYRSYVAPVQFGSFEIKFPKTWSSYVIHENRGTQVSLTVNPDFIRRVSGNDEIMAARIVLQERPKDQYMLPFTSLVKTGKLKQGNITVSGQAGYDLTGNGFPDKRTIRSVVIPVRDKVLVFSTENSKYANEFNEILAQSKIIP